MPASTWDRFEALRATKDQFEQALGQAAKWDDKPGKKAAAVYVTSQFDDVADVDLWPAMLDGCWISTCGSGKRLKRSADWDLLLWFRAAQRNTASAKTQRGIKRLIGAPGTTRTCRSWRLEELLRHRNDRRNGYLEKQKPKSPVPRP